jgi:hypothetical protein
MMHGSMNIKFKQIELGSVDWVYLTLGKGWVEGSFEYVMDVRFPYNAKTPFSSSTDVGVG